MNPYFIKPVLNSLYQSITEIKNKAYDWGLANPIQLKVPVISVGNLSFGGSGKTPMIKFLIRQLVHERQVAVVSKSYKTSLAFPEKVQLKKNEDQNFNPALYYGDEPCLIAQAFPQVSVWSGPIKSETALQCLHNEKPDCLLIDDGFSHRKLYRDLDIILIDISTLEKSWYREFWSNLNRAQIVILTKVESLSLEKLEEFKTELAKKFSHLNGFIFTAKMKPTIQNLNSQKAFLVTGVAHNESVKSTLESFGVACVEHKSFADHHPYSNSDMQDIYHLWQRLKMNDDLQIVTTSKDILKWPNPNWVSGVAVMDYEWQIESDEQRKIYEKIKSLF